MHKHTQKKISKARLRQAVLIYLAKNKLMTIATAKGARPWAATVFFAYTRKPELLFFSRPDTRHCQHIAKNPYVAVTINQDWGGTHGVKGLQIAGKALRVPQTSHRKYYALYRARYPWADKFPDHELYIIKPHEIHFINQELFGHFFRVRVK